MKDKYEEVAKACFDQSALNESRDDYVQTVSNYLRETFPETSLDESVPITNSYGVTNEFLEALINGRLRASTMNSVSVAQVLLEERRQRENLERLYYNTSIKEPKDAQDVWENAPSEAQVAHVYFDKDPKRYSPCGDGFKKTYTRTLAKSKAKKIAEAKANKFGTRLEWTKEAIASLADEYESMLLEYGEK